MADEFTQKTSISRLLLVIVSVIILFTLGIYIGFDLGKSDNALEPVYTVSPEVEPIDENNESAQTIDEENDNWKNYVNIAYGFELTLDDKWKNYQVIEEKLNNTIYLRFYIPTTSTKWTGSISGYADPFVISLYTPTEWDKIQAEEGPKPDYINKNSQYVFGYSSWQDCPEDLCDVITGQEIRNIISTFKFTK